MSADGLDQDFDYVIVGGGSAGCVLANRLSADPAVRVCLLEAGPEAHSPLIAIPIGIMALISNPRFNWCSRTVPQPNAAGREIFVPHGKVLGGGSSINGMVYMRGDADDYDGWAAAGNLGWSYAEVLPYFVRSEDNQRWTASPLHGRGGPMAVADMRTINPTAHAFVEAAALLQIPRSDDFNVPHPLGAGMRQVTQRRGRRESVVTAFLDPVRDRGNLAVVTEAMIDRVVLDGRRASAVAARIGGETRVIRSRREVVLCAGAFGSPAILQRSGIGDPDGLSAVGIDVSFCLPGVGANLQDHHTAMIMHKALSRVPYGLSLGALPRLAGHGLSYLFARRGLLSSNSGEAAAFVCAGPHGAQADIQLSFVSGRRGTGLKVEQWGHGYGITAILLHPQSRGSVAVRSADANDPPAIDLGAFGVDADLDALVAGLKLAREVLGAPSFARYRAHEVTPGPAATDDAALRDYVRRTSATAFHPAGTCAMGSGDGAVVDPTLKVHGIEALRVADASIMPRIVGGNTNAPVIMIAEKAADMILGRLAPEPIHLAEA